MKQNAKGKKIIEYIAEATLLENGDKYFDEDGESYENSFFIPQQDEKEIWDWAKGFLDGAGNAFNQRSIQVVIYKNKETIKH